MKFYETEIPAVIIIEPEVFRDERGYFFESFNQRKFEEAIGYSVCFCQDNESKSKYGILRGLHYQIEPFVQSKLVRVVKGKVLDVAVDLRQKSPTFAKHVTVELSASNKKQLFIPRGFAHGFITLSNEAILHYKVDNYYSSASDRGIRFDDEALGIDWRFDQQQIRLSQKDLNNPMLKQADLF